MKLGAWVSFLEAGVSLLVGTRDAELVPDAVRGVGIRVNAAHDRVTLFLAAATSAAAVANLRDNGRIAVTCARVTDHRTLQLKGPVLAVRDAVAEDAAVIDRYRGNFAKRMAIIGVPVRFIRRMAHWPAFAVDVQVDEIFEQTPGPRAGEPLVGDPR